MIKVNELTKNMHFEVKKGKFITTREPSGGDKSAFLYIFDLFPKSTIEEKYLDGNKI